MIAPNIIPEGQARQAAMEHAQAFLAPLYARRDALLREVAEEFDVPQAELTGGVSSYAVLPARRVAVALTVETLSPPFTRDTIAGFFNIGDATLYRFVATVRQWEETDPIFRHRMAFLRPRVREVIKLLEEKPNG